MVVSTILLIKSNPLHQNVYLTSANSVSSTVYDLSSGVSSYFNLRESNEDLNRRNADLQSQVATLEAQVDLLRERFNVGINDVPEVIKPYDFIVAHVIKNSVMKQNNYLTINKGTLDGIKPEMGVIDQNGVVGIVNVVGPHSARVISLLNPHFRLSCKIKNNDNFGSLVWDGRDPRFALLQELPRHTEFQKGDTIITSGYSAVFPPGIPIGIIESENNKATGLRVRLLTDFSTLDNVQVVVNYIAEEVNALEEEEKQLEESTNM